MMSRGTMVTDVFTMLSRCSRRIALLLLLLFVSGRGASAETRDPIVVLLSLDGLANFYLEDPQAEMSCLRQIVAQGVKAEGMIASMPSVTWPNHTTLVTGVSPAKHGVLGNSVLDRTTGQIVPLVVDPVFNKEELVKAPTVYDLAREAGKKTAALIWPASRGAKTLDWTVPDVGTLDLVKQFTTPVLMEEFAAAGIPWDKQEEYWATDRIQERDLMFTRMGLHIMQNHRPDLLLMHLVELDHAQHRYGPRSPQAYAAIKHQDDCVRQLWEALQKDYNGKATLVIVSDHGFIPYQKQVLPNVLLRQQGLLTTLGSRITGGSVRALSQGGACFIYVLDEANRSSLTAQLAEQFRQLEGVGQVLTRETFAAAGLPTPEESQYMSDIMLSAKVGYNFVDMPAGEEIIVTLKDGVTKGSHGSDVNEPGMHAAFIAWGAQINKTSKLGIIRNTAVAPTLAALLGLEMDGTESPALGVVQSR